MSFHDHTGLRTPPSRDAREPLILTVPGLCDSGPRHWQTLWEQTIEGDIARVDLGGWDDPHRNTWVNKLNLAIHRADRPVILAAHSLGCLAVAWWVEYEALHQDHNVVGALLVAPPEVDGPEVDPRLARFAPPPAVEFPFPSVVVASRDDPWITFARARNLARAWGSLFADAGPVGHINAESGLGDWPFGQALLRQLTRRSTRERRSWLPPIGAPANEGLVAA